MLNRITMSRLLLGRRLTDVENIELKAYENQQMILARKEQIASAGRELCRLPMAPVAGFAAGGLTGILSDSKPSTVPLIMRIVSLAKLI